MATMLPYCPRRIPHPKLRVLYADGVLVAVGPPFSLSLVARDMGYDLVDCTDGLPAPQPFSEPGVLRW